MPVGALVVCEKKAAPGERAGKALDQAVVGAGKNVEEAGEKSQNATREARK
jgi:hypothetical protein